MTDSQKPRIYRMFRIGIDCHRTTLDIGPAIQRIAKQKFGVSIPPDATRSRFAVGKYLTREAFESILNIVVARPSYVAKHIQEHPGAFDVIHELEQDGHYVEIVTSSDYDAHIAILYLLKQRNIRIPTRAIGRRELKSVIANQYDIILDDNPEQAEACALYGTPFVYILETPTNRNQAFPDRTTRVKSFHEFLEHVRELGARLYPLSL